MLSGYLSLQGRRQTEVLWPLTGPTTDATRTTHPLPGDRVSGGAKDLGSLSLAPGCWPRPSNPRTAGP